jgi:hypothetical protein
MPVMATFSRAFVQKLEIPFATSVRGNTIASITESALALLWRPDYRPRRGDLDSVSCPFQVPPAPMRSWCPPGHSLWVAAVAGLGSQIVRSTNAGFS